MTDPRDISSPRVASGELVRVNAHGKLLKKERIMKCKKCGSNDLIIVPNGPHQELVCNQCLTHQKFLSKKEVWRFYAIRDARKRGALENTWDTNLGKC
jgi:late competence protein required for DNA uptake (superfamily II DNA/RNA helicase)